MRAIYDKTAHKCSKSLTRLYTTSFSIGVLLLANSLREGVYAVYGFVRIADEIVDTWSGIDQRNMLMEFKDQFYRDLERGISTNPILHAFIQAVKKYNIERELIDQFLASMEMDLEDVEYSVDNFEQYILGSAEVVGLMCLRVFCQGDEAQYQSLKPAAMRLGSALQKVNFSSGFEL